MQIMMLLRIMGHMLYAGLSQCAENQKREETFPELDDQGRLSGVFGICIDSATHTVTRESFI